MGNSRTSTFSILSMNGVRMCRPGWSTALNSPNRLTTPTLPCWTILMNREANSATMPTAARAATITIPTTSPADANMGTSLLGVAGVNDEQATLDVGDDDIGPDGDT